jgi:hypothetical protein
MMTQSAAQVTRSTKGWNNSPEKDLQVDTSNFSDYPESFEESFASESQSSPPLKPKQGAAVAQPTTTIDDLISDDEDLSEAEITPTSRSRDKQEETEEEEEGGVRPSRGDSIDTISRQRPSAREAFSSKQGLSSSHPSGLLSPVDGGDDDEVYGQLEESLQHDDDPSHSAILDESGEHVLEEDQHELNQSRRSNQEDEEDYRQLTQSSAIKRSLFNPPAPAATAATGAAPAAHNRSNEDDDDYFDDDFEESEAEEGKDDKARGDKHEEEEASYVESLEEEIEEADDEEHDFSYGGASSGDEDMLNRKNKSDEVSVPTRGSASSSSDTLFARSAARSEVAAPGRRNASGGQSAAKYDHNSSDEEDSPYLPSTNRRSTEPEKKTFAKTDENSDDEDLYPAPTSTASARGGSLFSQQKKPQLKYDDNSSRDEGSDDNDVPETGSASDFSAGGSDGESSFLHEESLERGDFDPKARGDSNEFSMSEQEISGSHVLDGFDYTTNALPPARRLGGR